MESALVDFYPEVKELHEDLELLNGFYIETRYVGDFPEFTWNDAVTAHAAAARIKEFVLKKVQ